MKANSHEITVHLNDLSELFTALSGDPFSKGVSLVPGFLGTLLSNGLVIVGWVSLWHPIEIFLYEWWPDFRENQLYTHVMNMQIILEEEKATRH